jgi:WD40 repeat protein
VAWRLYPSGAARYAMLAAATRPGLAVLSGGSGASQANDVAFSPGGRILAAASSRGVQLWDVATRRLIGRPLHGIGHADAASVAFSPDGAVLATGATCVVRLWHVATEKQAGRPLGRLPTGGRTIDSVAFSPDGRTLASGSDNGTVRLWNVAYLTDLIPQLCASAGGLLTRAEWTRYVSPGPARPTATSAPERQIMRSALLDRARKVRQAPIITRAG